MLGKVCIFLGVGLAFLAGCVPLLSFLSSNPWAVALIAAVALIVVGAFIELLEHGLVGLLPSAFRDAILRKSLLSLVMDTRLSLRHIREPYARASSGDVEQARTFHLLVRLLALSFLDLEDELVAEVVAGLDEKSRRVIFRPGLAWLMSPLARRLVIGRTGQTELSAALSKSSMEGSESDSISRLSRERRNTATLAQEVQILHQHLESDGIKREEHRSAQSCASRRQGGSSGLGKLLLKILHFELVILPLRHAHEYAAKFYVWRQFARAAGSVLSVASHAARFVMAPLAWARLRWARPSTDEIDQEKKRKLA